jgi:Phytochelatin synthase
MLVAVLAVGSAAVLLRPAQAPPPGFVSLRASETFQAPAVLERAWALPVAATYPHPVVSQTNPSACGPTSVANVLRSMQQPATADDVAAHGAGCFAGICFAGLTLAQLGAASSAVVPPGWSVTVLRPASVEALRDELRHANDPNRRYVVNLHRFPLFGTGGGHHSPIGGYLEADDLMFVLDVNASYGPWLVPTERLFDAMNTFDSSSGEKRGLLRFER